MSNHSPDLPGHTHDSDVVACCRICRLHAPELTVSSGENDRDQAPPTDQPHDTQHHQPDTDSHATAPDGPAEDREASEGTTHAGHATGPHPAAPHDGDAPRGEHAPHDGDAGNGSHQAHSDHSGHEAMFRRRFWVSLALSIPVLVFSEFIQATLGYTAPVFPGSTWITPVLAVVVFAYGGVPFLSMARTEAANREPGMMLLISLAITVAFAYSLASLVIPRTTPFFWELVTLVDIMLLGHWLEMRSVRQASGALDELARLMPDTAERVSETGAVETVPVTALEMGDILLVRPGASVPADGQVVEGESAIDESMITGESRPVDKDPGSEVIAGTVNQDGSLRVEVTKTGDETALAGIMRLVADAQSSKSRTQLLADRAAGWLFYVALGAAAFTAVAWILAVGFEVAVLERVVTVLVIACPHALGLAVPLVVAINTSTAARNGMLVRDRIAMEESRNLDTVIFDKTGTLTKGEQGVVDVATVDGWNEDRAFRVAHALEADSEHMIARAIRDAADERGVDAGAVSGFENLRGLGVTATVGGETYHVGGPNLLERLDIARPEHIEQFAAAAGQQAQTVVYLVHDTSEVVAAFALADVIRTESRQTVQALHSLGIEVAMLTGDSEDVAAAVSDELGIDQFFAEVLPDEKDSAVAQLQHEGKLVAMVGDGVNDAPALARADVGIAIGSGTDVAIESADIILVENNPLDVVRLVKLSQASYRKMQENLVWATGYNVLAIPLAAGLLAPIGILLSPAIGAVFMSLSTIIVAINARRLKNADLSIPT